MLKKIGKNFQFLGTLVVYWGLAVLWLHYGYNWAHGVYLFLFWLNVSTKMCLVLNSKSFDMSKLNSSSSFYVNKTAVFMSDLLGACYLAAFGHFWLAAFTIVDTVCESTIRDKWEASEAPTS